MARSKKGGEASKSDFLDALAETASVTHACKLTRLPRRTVYNWRNADTAFAEAWDASLDMGTDALEDEAVRRAFQGTKKPIFRGKDVVGHAIEYSDNLLMFMLKARRPERFRDRAPQQQGGDVENPLVALIRQIQNARTALPLGHGDQEWRARVINQGGGSDGR